MRTLDFIVEAQTLAQSPDCDFDDIVAGSVGYLRARFKFSSDWRGTTKIARFYRGEKEYAVLIENGVCDIPSEVLIGATFKVRVLGTKGPYRIETNRLLIQQEVTR